MNLGSQDLGVLGNLAEALGIFKDGSPNGDWFTKPDTYLKDILAKESQREALIAFVDEVLGGADASTQSGLTWLPIVDLDDPKLRLAVTVDTSPQNELHIGLGLQVFTTNPASETTLAIPLFRTRKGSAAFTGDVFLLGTAKGRLRMATLITVDGAPPVPGQARIGGIGLDVDLPTGPGNPGPSFGLTLEGLQLPGATAPRDVRVSAADAGALDDALLDLVLSLVRAQADGGAPGSPIAAVAGLLGLRSGDAVPDFPITLLPTQGPRAIADWLRGIVQAAASRNAWLGYLASLLGGNVQSSEARFALGGPGAQAALALSLLVDQGPSGNTRLTPRLGVTLGNNPNAPRARIAADLLRIDLVTGDATALPSLGAWVVQGGPGNRVLDVAGPPAARADALRVGFALDVQRRPTFVLAADNVAIGGQTWDVLDLTSPDALMDVAGSTVAAAVDQLLLGLGNASTVVRQLLGLTPPAGVTALDIAGLMANPVGAVCGYWQNLLGTPAAATLVLDTLRSVLADASAQASSLHGSGTAADPWQLPMIGPFALEASMGGSVLTVSAVATTSVDTLGARCTVVDMRVAATLARLDLSARTAELLPGVEALLSARERGVNPARARIALAERFELLADRVGLKLAWSPAAGLQFGVDAPNLRLAAGSNTLPIAMPTIASDGSVTLPAAAWDGVQLLVGLLADLARDTGAQFLPQVTRAFGWNLESPQFAGGDVFTGATLRLADLVANPGVALADWLPRLALSDLGPRALELVADLFAGSGANRGVILGRGHPDDPYRFALAAGLPQLAVWFPPEGLEPLQLAAPLSLRNWRPGDPGLDADVLASALADEARVAADVRDLVDGRAIGAGLAALAARWEGGDGLIAPPSNDPAGITVRRVGLSSVQLFGRLDFEDLIDRIPATVLNVAVGAGAWPDAPAGRRIDLTAPGLEAAMFTLPVFATGDWFVALGPRADCRTASSGSSDGTPEQAARLLRVLEGLAGIAGDIAVVALGGAGHAARVAVDAPSAPAVRAAVRDLVLLGTPLSAISLSALDLQPTADALRLLYRLVPAADGEPDDEDLALGRGLVRSMMDFADRADPESALRLAVVDAPATRAGLTVTAQFGTVGPEQVQRAITAIVAAGLAARARARVEQPLPPPTGVHAGVRWELPALPASGQLAITGAASLALFGYDLATGPAPARVLRVRLRVGDRGGWLAATPALSLRAVSCEIEVPLDGSSPGTTRLTLLDARVMGQQWERLALGLVDGVVLPVLPEARVLLAAAMQRLATDVGGGLSVVFADLLRALGIIETAGGLVADAVDQLVHDPGGLLRQRLQLAADDLQATVSGLLGLPGAGIDLDTRTVHVQGGGASAGRFGWSANVDASPAGLSGTLRLGPDAALPVVGGLQLRVNLAPLSASLHWHHPNGSASDVADVWPSPDANALARMLARAAPGLGAQAALEMLRRGDASAQPLIDALLDALGLLAGVAGDAQRAIRPMAGLLRDPAGWLRSAGSLASNPARIQSLFDALRPLMDLAGANGTALPIASGVSLSVSTSGPGAALALDVDPSAWTAPAGGGARLAAGLGASLVVKPAGAPTPALSLFLGVAGAASGRQAVHVRIGTGGIEVFLRPTAGADIPLVPFAGLGSLAAVAQAALPFLLDQLAGLSAPVGPLVAKIGDALALRSGNPKAFDGAALQAWAANPAGALTNAIPSILSTGLATIQPLLAPFVPAGLSIGGDATRITVTRAPLTFGWSPASGAVTLEAANLPVPGIDALAFKLGLGPDGLGELSVTAGPAQIDAGGVTLRPFVIVAAGPNASGGARVVVGLAVDDTHRFAARWLLQNPVQFALVASNGTVASPSDVTTPAAVATRVVEVLADLVASVALSQGAVQTLLGTAIGSAPGSNVRQLVTGVLLSPADPTELIAGMFDPATLLGRAHRLFQNLAAAAIAIPVGAMSIALKKGGPGNDVIGLEIGLTDRVELVTGDVMLWLENDDAWIKNQAGGSDGGLFLGVLRDAAPLAFKPTLEVLGLGLRIGKSSGPLIDAGISIDSIAMHAFASIDATGVRGGGAQLQFSNLAVSTGGAGGSNGIAQGVMRDTGPTPPRPAFSPALAIASYDGALEVSLRAGDPPGPWWIAIQKGFGPLYLEQVGFDAKPVPGKIERVSLLMDGSVSMFGLTCAVDDLQITYFTGDGDFFDADNWKVDLAGLAVSANMGGVSIAGGLLKQVTNAGQANEQIEYLGMLLGRFAVYGLTIYGGYGQGFDDKTQQKFTAFFAIGAVNGPIGGPPAFFLTGIGGGFGINRLMRVPSDFSNFGDYPLIQALDIAATPGDPMTQLRKLGEYFPMQKGTFWFAAGLSFNSFALVDGIAVVGVQIGDGLDINLLGLARMALPRPQAALVSIEVGLLVRFSSTEGVLWVQGQLTDNSWLLYPDIKLTGGFAYVIWFKGERGGEFVLTLGGYHPDFHRAGYPVVPRLGLRWSIGDNIVIKAGSYFALTSEALMAGGDFEGSAQWGPAWARVGFGAHGIVYFDPFSYQVNAYARIAAGVTVDTYIFGEVTISISLGARIDVMGPEFRGSVTFEVGPVELTFDFGGDNKAQKNPLSADAFVGKFLEVSDDGAGAQAHALMTGKGALPAKGEDSTPDGSSSRPFVVVVEFSLTFTSTVPAVSVQRVSAPIASPITSHTPSRALGVAPMGKSSVKPQIKLTWRDAGGTRTFPFQVTVRPFGRFPVGVWGPPQDDDNRKVPKAEMIEALNELELLCDAHASGGGPEIPYYQVEIGRRKPLPFTRRSIDISGIRQIAQQTSALVSAPATVDAAFTTATLFLKRSATPTTLAAMRGERQSPPRPGTLTEGLETATATEVPTIAARPAGKVYDHFIDAPVAVALLPGATRTLRSAAATRARTTVADSERAWRTSPPDLASVSAQRSKSIAARLVVMESAAASTGRTGTLIGAMEVPPTASARTAAALVARTGGAMPAPLADFGQALVARAPVKRGDTRRRAAEAAGALLAAGDTVVLKLPNARADAVDDAKRPLLTVSGAPARVVLLGNGGERLSDQRAGDDEANHELRIPQGTERIVAIGLGGEAAGDVRRRGDRAGLAGWHAGQQMPYVGWGTAIGPGCVVQTTGGRLPAHRERGEGGWVAGAELARGVTTVVTTFTEPSRCVLIVLDDPASDGRGIEGRQLLMGLDGASRATDRSGAERAPVLLTLENRSVLAYDVEPELPDVDGVRKPVTVTVASEEGWSLVGVLAAESLDAASAVALIGARGLDAALRPLAPRGNTVAPSTRLSWRGPLRTDDVRRVAKARATGTAPPSPPRALRLSAAPTPRKARTKTATPRRKSR